MVFALSKNFLVASTLTPANSQTWEAFIEKHVDNLYNADNEKLILSQSQVLQSSYYYTAVSYIRGYFLRLYIEGIAITVFH